MQDVIEIARDQVALDDLGQLEDCSLEFLDRVPGLSAQSYLNQRALTPAPTFSLSSSAT